MKQNKTDKSEETKKKLLESGLKLFTEKGFEQTTMRHIAKKASMSLGAAYYYFRSKDEFVLALFERNQQEASAKFREGIDRHKTLKERLSFLTDCIMTTLGPYRKLYPVLAKNAVDRNNPISPFSSESAAIREDAIAMYGWLFENTKVSVDKQMLPYLPKLFWFYQLGIIFFWMNDESDEQKQTKKLIKLSMDMILQLMTLTSVVIFKPINKSIIKLIRVLEGKDS